MKSFYGLCPRTSWPVHRSHIRYWKCDVCDPLINYLPATPWTGKCRPYPVPAWKGQFLFPERIVPKLLWKLQQTFPFRIRRNTLQNSFLYYREETGWSLSKVLAKDLVFPMALLKEFLPQTYDETKDFGGLLSFFHGTKLPTVGTDGISFTEDYRTTYGEKNVKANRSFLSYLKRHYPTN